MTQSPFSIVAVHGLDGDSVSSWTDSASRICWLSHPDFLPFAISNARILTFGYDANTMADRTSSATLTEHADSLVESLVRRRCGTEVRILRHSYAPNWWNIDTGPSNHLHCPKPRRYHSQRGEC